MSIDLGRPEPVRRRLARIVTETFAPAVWAAAMPVVVAVDATGTASTGVAWAAIAVLFCAVVPYSIIWLGVARGRLTDHHIGRREQRLRPMLAGLVSVLVGLVLLAALGAPGPLVVMVVTIFVVGAGCTVVNRFWKLSVHSAVAAASVTVLVVTFGPALLPAAAVVPLTGWSRVELHDHTVAQVLAGVLTGSALAVATFVPFT